MADVKLEHVRKTFPGNIQAVQEFNLDINNHEFIVLVGPSGCGKSTTLRMIAGLEEITEGTISIGTRVVNDVPPKDRDIAMVFQNYALYPHMTVYDNMAFGLKMRKFKKTEINARVQNAANILGISELLRRRPKALSGGERQRVAVGRAIVRQPAAFLFDEPLSNLDAKLRVQMRVEISKLHNQLETTMIYVTHDQVEAMTMGDRIVVMKGGLVQQVAEPTQLYDRPTNRFVASFIGTPPMNFMTGIIVASNDTVTFRENSFGLKMPGAWKKKLTPYHNKEVTFGIRPEDLGNEQLEQSPDAQRIKAKVEVIEPMGSETYLYLNTGANSFISRVDSHRHCEIGQDVELAANIDKVHFFDNETEEAIV